LYFHTARVLSPDGVKRHPPPKTAKNQGPDSIVMPTLRGTYDT
jgi:hypothetical protein